MAEMSLRLQIEQIEQVRRYIYELQRMFNELEQGIIDRLRYISESGVRTETVEKMRNYLKKIQDKRIELNEILREEERFLLEKKENLEAICVYY